MRCDVQGLVRGKPSLLASVAKVAYKGWKSGVPIAPINDVEEPPGITEYARLSAPPIEVSVISCCCGTNLPHASVSIDEELDIVGSTGADGMPVKCCMRSGEHIVNIHSA